MVNETIDEKSPVRITRTRELNYRKNQKSGNTMLGISYITKEDAKNLQLV